MKKILIAVVASTASLGWAAVAVTVRGTSPTQAILSYTLSAPTGSACTVEISESPSYAPLAHDVDAGLFSGSNLDSRSGSIASGGYRVFVAGTRGAAQPGLDGRWYSRALAANTLHYFRINNNFACDSGGAATGTFVTAAIPSGRLYNDPIPSAGSGPAWPRFYGTSRTPVTDPQTGAKMVPLNVPGENVHTSDSAAAFDLSFDTTGAWANAANIATGSGSAATFSSPVQTPVFLAINLRNLTGSNGATYETLATDSIDYLRAAITGSGAATSAADRSVNVCWSLAGGGNRCDTPVLTQALGSSSGTVNVGGLTPGMTDWGASFSGLDPQLAAQHTGSVTVSGAALTWAGGNLFRPQTWMAGTRITLTGGCTGTYSLASVADDHDLTLAASPVCTSGPVNYKVTPLTAIIAKTTTSTDPITLSHVTFDYQLSFGMDIGSSAMQDGNLGCGPAAVTSVTPPGYVCGSTYGYYLVQTQSVSVTYLGRWQVGYTPGVHPATDCPPLGFSATDPRTIWCFVTTYSGGAYNHETLLYKVTYNGDFSAVAGGTVLASCAANGNVPPCLQITQVGNSTLEAQFAAAYPGLTVCCWQVFTQVVPLMGGQLGDGNIQLQMWLGPLQGLMSVFSVYDPVRQQFIAGRDSWSYYPVTYSGVHSVQLRRGAHYGLPLAWVGHGTAGGDIGPLSGTDSFPGFGPYRMKTTSTMTNVSCPGRPGNSLIPAAYWPGGASNAAANCVEFTVDGGVCDPSPFALAISVTTSAGSATIMTSSTFWRSYVGKPIVINGNTYTITGWTDGENVTIFPPAAASGTFNATFLGEAPDSGTRCGQAGDFFLRNAAPGDIFFVGAPTSGVSGYADFASTSGSESFLILAVDGTTLTAQRNYGGTGAITWPAGVYLYADSGGNVNQSATQFDFPWDYVNDPTGALGKTGFDGNPPQGHAFLADSASMGYVNAAPCPQVVQWDGHTDRQCLQGRFGPNLGYITAPVRQLAYAPAYSGQTGSGLANQQDLHPSYPYFTTPQYAVDGRVWNGDTNRPAPASPVSGSLYRFNFSQRGCSSAAQCISLEHTLPLQVNCGQTPGRNVSGPSASLTDSAADAYKYATVVAAGEGIGSSQPGDLLMNCPGSSLRSSYEAFINNGGDRIDIGAYFAGPWMHGIVREGFSAPSPGGEHIQWIGHNLMRPRYYSPFFNVRGTPDGLGILSQVPGLDGVRTMDVLTVAPAFVKSDSINGADFVPLTLQLSPPHGLGIDNALVEFGYGEYGDPASGPFCTPRQETCVKGNQAGNGYHYATSESGSYSGQPCSSGCAATVPGISGRSLYYRVKYRAGGTVKFTAPLEVAVVP